MDRDSESEKHYRNSERYLEQTGDGYSINPSSGLYEPNPREETREISEDRRVEIVANPLPISTRRDWKDTLEVFASGVGLLVAGLGIAISIGTLFLLVKTVQYARGQWQEMSASTQAQIQALEEGKRANSSNARDNQRSYDLSRESLEDVQRAFIFPSPILAEQRGSDGARIGIQISIGWANSGATPTRNMKIHANFQNIDSESLPEGFDFRDKWDSADPKTHINQKTFLGPKASLSAANQIFFPEAFLPSITYPQKRRMVLWGWAMYRDVFDNTPIHITEYCYKISGMPEPPSPNSTNRINLTIPNCDMHNCVDQECKDYKTKIREF
jgi:hypothetical protein